VDKTQLWIAVCVYVLAASIKKETALEISLYTFLQIYPFILSRKSNWNVFLEVEANYAPSPSANQLKLFDN
jgi:hypothetical protein